MTIGIAVSGPMAGLAAFRALAAVEAVGRGAIGGFASLAVITASGALLRADTQRGGTRTLFTRGEDTGVEPPEAFAAAPIAALMSSGPDRPAPLSQFTPGSPAGGLVTGHRLPNERGPDDVPLNCAVLAALERGEAPAQAIASVIALSHRADAGFIAVARDGRIALGETDLVLARDDRGALLAEDPQSGQRVAVMHNAIHPHGALAALVVSVARDTVAPADCWDFEVEVAAGLPLRPGAGNGLILDTGGKADHITVARNVWLSTRWEGAALLRGAEVRRDGAVVGHVGVEPYCVAENGRLVSLSGRSTAAIGIRNARG